MFKDSAQARKMGAIADMHQFLWKKQKKRGCAGEIAMIEKSNRVVPPEP